MSYSYEQTVDNLIGLAQESYALDRFGHAAEMYGAAYQRSMEPESLDLLTAARAARGVYEVRHRQTGQEGVAHEWRYCAKNVLGQAVEVSSIMHGWSEEDLYTAASVPDEALPVVREIIQSKTSVGTAALFDVVRSEHDTGERSKEMEGDVLRRLDRAGKLLHLVEKDGTIDQCRVDLEVPMAFAHRLYGNRAFGSEIAKSAVAHAKSAEARARLLAASPGLSEKGLTAVAEKHRIQAKAASGSFLLPHPTVLKRAFHTI